MKIAYLVERPTQFEAPLFRWVAEHGRGELEPWFTAADPGGELADPELERAIDWGFELCGGYPHQVMPGVGTARWLQERLARGVALLIVNGYRRPDFRLAARLARRAGVPTALRLDSVLAPESWLRRMARRFVVRELLGRRFDRFLATGSLTREYLLAQGIAAERVGRFPYAVDHEHFATQAAAARPARAELRARLGIPPEATVIFALAKLHRREAPDDLLGARERLSRSDLWWVLAGDGPERPRLEQVVRDRQLDRVLLPGYLRYAELPSWYAAADLFVHPAREERWGVSVAEALACGLPVVASSGVGAARDLIVPGENGAVYEVGDTAALAEALVSTLELPAATVASTTARILPQWGYEATWSELERAAEEARSKR